MARGCFISFEGADGVGKSTQARLLAEALTQSGFETRLTREPGGTPEAEAVRKLLLEGRGWRTGGGQRRPWTPMAETLLHYAARAEHVARRLEPALAEGIWVVCDRFFDSSFVYQGYAGGQPLEQLEALNKTVLGDFVPDLTLVLDLDEAEAARRRVERGEAPDAYEQRGEAYQKKLRAGYRAQARTDPNRCILIEAHGTPDEVWEKIWSCVRERFALPKADTQAS